MVIYQCLFYKQGRIDYWENIEAISDVTIRQLLLDRLAMEVGSLPRLSLTAGLYVGSVWLLNSLNAVPV